MKMHPNQALCAECRLYNSGARVSEVTALKRAQVCFGASTFVQLTGKGRKERTVPLWSDTARVVKAWFEELGEDAGPMAFPNARGKALSREGVDYLLRLLLDSRVVALSMAHTPTFVILSSFKPFFFNRLKSELRFLDNVGA